MNTELVRQALQEAIAENQPVEDRSRISYPSMQPLLVPSLPPEARERFLSVLRSEPQLEIFSHQRQWFFNTAAEVTYDDLTLWLLEQSGSVGVEVAVENLRRYVEATEMLYFEVGAVGGIEPGDGWEVSPGIQLVRLESVPDSLPRRLFSRQPFDVYLQRQAPSAAFLTQVSLPIHHTKSRASPPPRPQRSHQSEFSALADLVSVIRTHAATLVGYWATPASWMPCGDRSWSYWGTPTIDETLRPQQFSAEAVRAWQDICAAYQPLPDARKKALAVPLRHLSRSRRSGLSVDGALDAGIALESILLGDIDSPIGEINFRLQVRAARLLGATLVERREIQGKVRRLYALRSIAAHKGDLPGSIEGRSPNVVLTEGQDVVGRLIKTAIVHGPADWAAVVFG
jgi:hypothetical protein